MINSYALESPFQFTCVGLGTIIFEVQSGVGYNDSVAVYTPPRLHIGIARVLIPKPVQSSV
jgi:hypothetical protein